MNIADGFLIELDEEFKTTRRFLERIPADMFCWKPHVKSHTAGQLAMHIAQIPGLISEMSVDDHFDMDQVPENFPTPKNTADILSQFDKSIITARRILRETSDERMSQMWQFRKDGKPFFSTPRIGLFRAILCNHLYHHRGQLGVYLRLMGASVPSAYGPSADEQPDFMK